MTHSPEEKRNSPEPVVSIARHLRQQLESCAGAGLTHIPRRAVANGPVVGVKAVVGSSEHAGAPSRRDSTAAPPVSPPKPPATVLPVAAAPIVTATAGAPRDADERMSRLKVLNEQVKQCMRCDELASTRTQTVFGVGNPLARIVFVGEAPGADEDAQGEPFVGKAGQLLNKIITACRLTRDEIYIANTLKCRPPGNRNPSPVECENCREFLEGQLATIDPEYIVCWGGIAAKSLLRSELTIGKLRGRFYQHGRAKVLCTYHPSYLLRNPAAKKDVWIDMQFLFADMGIELKSRESA
jgi:uracil-DNA glycosylase